MVQNFTKNPIIIRRVTLADTKFVKEVTDVINNAFRSEASWTTEREIISGLRCTESDVTKFIEESGKSSTLLFAFDKLDDKETVVGTVQIKPSLKNPLEAEICLVSVCPTHQSCGIGSKLVYTAIDEMRALGCNYASITVWENRSEILSWYKKLGFVETGERIPFYSPEVLLVNDLHFITLKKALKSE